VKFRLISKGHPVVQAEQMKNSSILTVNGVKTGFLGVVTDTKQADYIEGFISPEQVLRTGVFELRNQGAEIVVALTHLVMNEDKALLTALGDDAPDIIIGGHDHERQTALVNNRRIVKADADARTVAVIRIRPGAQHSRPDVQLEYVELPGSYRPDVQVEQIVNGWQKRFATEYCQDLQLSSDCLNKPLGNTQVELVAEELSIRRFETNLGNWLADLAKEQFADKGVNIALLNSGGMRLNQNVPAGSIITRKQLDTLFAYPTRLVRIRLTGEQLQQIIDHAVTDWTGSGHWLQISGFSFKHDPQENKAFDLRLMTDRGLRPVKADEEILAVVNDYLIDERGDRDGYTMLSRKLLAEPGEERPNLVDIVIDALSQAGDKGIAPVREGRICNIRDRLPCVVQYEIKDI